MVDGTSPVLTFPGGLQVLTATQSELAGQVLLVMVKQLIRSVSNHFSKQDVCWSIYYYSNISQEI
jgi:hypothetical protein